MQSFKSVNSGGMSKNRTKLTATEKLAIINETEQFGITQTLRNLICQIPFIKGSGINSMKAVKVG